MTIQEKCVSLMKEKGITYAELDKRTSYTRSTLQRYFTDPNKEITVEMIQELAPIFGVDAKWLAGWAEDSLSYKNIIPIKKKSVPMLGEIACGEPTFADHQYNTYVEADDNINADFCLRCKGDSMIGDGINDGDIIFIRKQETVENGEIACVVIDDEATLKHVYISDSNITLIASNTNYAPMVYGEHDAGTIKILGKAVALSRIL